MSESITIDGVGPMPVERPTTVAELCAIVKRCADTNTAVYPVGGGTMLDFGMPPARIGIALSTAALNQIIDYPARDLTITVQAGITIKELQATLAKENQWLPIDIPETATIGGAIACDVSGPRRYGYGTLRDYVIGITIVNDRGEETHAGGRVVKNVAGYDFMKLHTGALGTLGVLTQVTLKVKPKPETNSLVTGECSSGQLTLAMETVLASQTRPVAVELILIAGAPKAHDNRFRSDWQVTLAFEGSSESVAWQTRQAATELSAARLEPVEELPGKSVTDSIREWHNEPVSTVDLQINLPPSSVADFVRRMGKLPAGAWLQARAARGVICFGYERAAVAEVIEPFLPGILDAAHLYGGNLTIRRCPSTWKESHPVWGHPPADLALQKAVKRALDPQNLFNPGRFVTDQDY